MTDQGGSAQPAAAASPTTVASTTTTAPTTTTTTAPTTTTTTAPPAPRLAAEAGPLRSGAKGARTLALQQALIRQKYDPGTPDGSFGLLTTQAVWAWQALHGLDRTGVVEPGTESLILAATSQPMLRPDLGPTHTEVDLGRQVILVFRDGQPVLISHVSSGKRSTPTPTGSYHFERRIKGWRTSKLGRLYNPVYFVDGYAVHGGPSVPNVPASHGCVRIPMHIAQYFPSLVVNGDPVAVFRT